MSSRTRPSFNRAAVKIGRSNTTLGAFYQRLAVTAGKAKAVTITARKIAVLLNNTLRYGMTYKGLGASREEELYNGRIPGNRLSRAKVFDFVLLEMLASEESVVH